MAHAHTKPKVTFYTLYYHKMPNYDTLNQQVCVLDIIPLTYWYKIIDSTYKSFK